MTKRKYLPQNKVAWKAMKAKIRNSLIELGYGLCSRGSLTYEMLCSVFGKRFTKKMWSESYEEA